MAFTSEKPRMDHQSVVRALEESIDTAYRTAMLQYATCIDLDELKERVDYLDEHVARGFLDYIQANPEKGREEVLISVLNVGLESNDAGYVLFAARNSEDEVDTGWDDIEGGTSLYSMSLSFSKGLRSVSEQYEAPDDIINASAEDQSRAASLLRVTQAVWEINYGVVGIDRTPVAKGKYLALSDKQLIAFAVERHEDADAMVEIITERRVADYDTISAVLNSSTNALRVGAL
jgi:hypothetical protein